MPKIPLEEYIEHLQTLNLEGTIKSLMDEAGKAEEAIKNLEEQIKEHDEIPHAGIACALDILTSRMDTHVEKMHQKIDADILRLGKTIVQHIGAHQAVLEGRNPEISIGTEDIPNEYNSESPCVDRKYGDSVCAKCTALKTWNEKKCFKKAELKGGIKNG